MWVPFNASLAGYPGATDWASPSVQRELYQHAPSTNITPCDWDYEHENLVGDASGITFGNFDLFAHALLHSDWMSPIFACADW